MNEILNDIAAHLNTTDKNLVISAAIAGLVDQGLTVRVAYELIFGAGSYEAMAGELYKALRS